MMINKLEVYPNIQITNCKQGYNSNIQNTTGKQGKYFGFRVQFQGGASDIFTQVVS